MSAVGVDVVVFSCGRREQSGSRVEAAEIAFAR